MPLASAAPTFKDAFVAAAQTVWSGTDVQVSFGHPGQSLPDDIVSFGALTSEQEFATYGSNRGREETLVLDVVVSCYRGGGAEAEKVASDRAYELLGVLEQYVRVTDTTLGGVVRQCFLLGHTSEGSTDPDVLAQGRLIDITAQFVAKARVTS